MKKRGKKGISPLIATVLLIGFVIAVAAVVMLWGRGFIEERAQKEGALAQAQLDCNLIEIEINDDYSVTNIGNLVIGGFIIRNSGATEDTTMLNPLESTPSGFVNSGEEIIPAIRPEGAGAPLVPCSEKGKKLR